MTNYPLFTYCPTYSVLLFLRFHDALSLFLKKYDYGMIRCSYFMLFLLLLFTYILKKKFTKWLMTFLISLPAMFPNVIQSFLFFLPRATFLGIIYLYMVSSHSPYILALHSLPLIPLNHASCLADYTPIPLCYLSTL